MFDFYSSMENPNQILESTIPMTNSEAGVSGEAVIVVDNRLTKATPLVTPYAILAMDTKAGVDVPTKYLRILKGNKYRANVTGVGTPLAGTFTAAISTDGMAIDAADQTTGKVEIVAYDPVNSKAIVMF